MNTVTAVFQTTIISLLLYSTTCFTLHAQQNEVFLSVDHLNSKNTLLLKSIQTISGLNAQLQTASCEKEKELNQQIKLQRTVLIKEIRLQKNLPAAPNLDLIRVLPPIIPCPEMQVIELLGIPGFAETDELVICGAQTPWLSLYLLKNLEISREPK